MKRIAALLLLLGATITASAQYNPPTQGAYYSNPSQNNLSKVIGYTNGLPIYGDSKLADNGINLLYNNGTITAASSGSSAIPAATCAYGINSHGDSVTLGSVASPITLGYAYLLRNACAPPGATNVNDGTGGDQAADEVKKLFNGYKAQRSNNPLTTSMIGINDYSQYTTQNQFNIYQAELGTIQTYGGIANDYWVQGSTCTKTTGFGTNDTTFSQITGASTTTQGDTLTCTITVTSPIAYLWYRVFDNQTGTFTYAVDGGTATAPAIQPGQPTGTIATKNGVTDTVVTQRIPLAAGTHTIAIQATSSSGTVSIMGLATIPPIKTFTGPFILNGGILHQYLGTQDALSAQFNTYVQQSVATYQADGLDTYFCDVRSYVGTSSAEMDPTTFVHPTNLGHAHLEQAFLRCFNGSLLGTTGASATVPWNTVTNPTTNTVIQTGTFTTQFQFNGALGSATMFQLTDTGADTGGTGTIFNVTALGATERVFLAQQSAAGCRLQMPQTGALNFLNINTATSGANFSSCPLTITDAVWNSTASSNTILQEQLVAAAGANPTETATFTMTGGGTGVKAYSFDHAMTTTQTTVGALPAAAAGNAGQWRVVSDNATATEGAVCAGSGTISGLAFSTGTQWKCF